MARERELDGKDFSLPALAAGTDVCMEVGGQCPVGFHLHAAWHTQSHRKLPVEGLVRAQLFSEDLAASSFLAEGILGVYKMCLSTKSLQEGRGGGKSRTGR